jgi:hypothetical protein
VVFAVMDRFEGHGTSWAAFGAAVTCVVLLATHRRECNDGTPNVLLRGALVWYSLLLGAGLVWAQPTDWFATNARTASALGFVVIGFASVRGTTIAEFYTRPHTRPSRWTTSAFRRFNLEVTLLWSAGFALVAVSHELAMHLDPAAAYTMFNWILPIVTLAIVADRARRAWDGFHEDPDAEVSLEQESLTALAFDWDRERPRSNEH